MHLIPRPLLLKEKGRKAPHPLAPSPEGEGEKRRSLKFFE